MSFLTLTRDEDTEIVVITNGQEKTLFRFKDSKLARVFKSHLDEYHILCFGVRPADQLDSEGGGAGSIS